VVLKGKENFLLFSSILLRPKEIFQYSNQYNPGIALEDVEKKREERIKRKRKKKQKKM
jgi:hypothetical protein